MGAISASFISMRKFYLIGLVLTVFTFCNPKELPAEKRLKWVLTSVKKPAQSKMDMFSSKDSEKKTGTLVVMKDPYGGNEFEVFGLRNISGYLNKDEPIWYLVDYYERNIYPFWTKDIEPFQSLKKKNIAKYKNKIKKLKEFNSAVIDMRGFWLSGEEIGEWRRPIDSGLDYATLYLPDTAERIFIFCEQNLFFLWSYQTDGISDFIATGFKKVSDDEYTFELNGKIKATFYILGPDKMKVVVKGKDRGDFSSNEYYRISDKDGFVPPDFYKDHIDLKKVRPRKLKQ